MQTTRPSVAAALAAAVLLASLARPAAAQDADSAVARRDTVGLSPLLVTAGKVPVRAAQTGFAITLIPSTELAARAPLFAADVLRATPGTHVDEAAGPGGPAIVRVRGGEEVYTLILMDGVQVNEAGGFFDFQGVTLGNVERVEIARGPQSALFGSSAMSGVVNFITRRGQAGPARFHGEWQGGGATQHGGSYRGTAGVHGGTAKLRYSTGAGITYSRGYVEVPHDVRSREASLRVDATPSARWGVTGIARFLGTDQHLPIRDAGATRLPLDPNAKLDRDRLVMLLSTRHVPSARWSHELRADGYRQLFVYDDEKDDVTSDSFFVFDANFSLRSTLWRGGAEYVGSFDALPGAERSPLTLVWGARWEREDLESETGGDFGAGVARFNRNNGALFGEARAALGGRVHVMVGVRGERYEGLEWEVTPRASAVLEAVPGRLRLRAAAGRAFKAPNLEQQYVNNPFIASNPDLDPERSTSWEAGADARSGPVTASLTYFRQTFFDLIRTVAQEGSEQQINRNLGESLAEGVEWAARWAAGARWALGTDGAWVRTEIRDNQGLNPAEYPIGEELPGRPDVVGSAFLELRPAPLVVATLRGTYVGAQTVLSERFSGRRVEIDPYLLAGADARYAVSPRTALFVRVDNLFDREYDIAFDRPGAPLTATVGLRFDAGGIDAGP